MTKAASKDQVDINVLSYIDDIVVASNKKASYISDPGRNFHQYARSQSQAQPKEMRLWGNNSKVLGCLVSTKGIEANPDKIKAILQM
jgi:hypothetical protein